MKKKLLSMLSILGVIGLTSGLLLACGEDNPTVDPGGDPGEDPIDPSEPTLYKVEFDSSEIYNILGINSAGYEAGATVNFTIEILDEDYIISDVSLDKVNLTIEEVSDGYSFLMPESDVEILVTTTYAPSIFGVDSPGQNKEYPESLEAFTPTRFDGESVEITEQNALGSGVDHKIYTFNLNSGRKVEANIIEVDLTKAKLTSYAPESGIATPYRQLQAYEEESGKKVMAIVNGDFFATGVGTSVNAYGRNNQIIKAAHNDNGVYDYTDLASDVPASNPMLIGVSGNEAKISSIIQSNNKEEVIKSRLSYLIVYENENREVTELTEGVIYGQTELNSTNNQLLIFDNGTYTIKEDQHVIKVSKGSMDGAISYGEITNITRQRLDGTRNYSDCDEYFYIASNTELPLSVGQNIGYSLTSPDGSFKYYSTIIGGRQSLVENGNIASTVTLENTNGAQTTNIPRTAVGVIDENHIVLCSIESLRYRSANTVTADDPYGVNLPELAEFLRYIGCYDAMNFDGGGSTQLITKNNDGNGEPKVAVRSSDYGTYDLNSSRSVYNTVIISTY